MGVDITNGNDNNVYSIQTGTVTYVNYTGNCWSSYIDVTNGNGIRIRYFHIKTISNQIYTGVPVNQGDLLGQMFSAGNCNLHVHIEKPDGNFLNSELFPFADNSDPIIGNTTFCLNGATFYSNRPALTAKVSLNNEDYLILYNKIDIISGAHDTRLTSTGGANGGYLAPFSIEYEIYNSNNQSINGPVENFDFSDPPPNRYVQYAFSYGSILTNFSYILTNDPDPLGNETPDKYFNTILRKNTTETWPNNSSIDAQYNNGAHYSDGVYNITLRATDVDNGHNPRHTVTSSSKIIIDNFRPYISRVKIYEGPSSNWILRYNRGWQWVNNSLQLEPQPITAYFSQTQDIKVEITTSEPMSEVTLKVANLLPSTQNCGTDLNKTKWEFIVPITNSPSGQYILNIKGKDLAGNPMQDIPSSIPIRQSHTVWTPNPTFGQGDSYHSFVLGSSIVDFTAKQSGADYNLIKFTDKSSGYYLSLPFWNFGDDKPTSTDLNPTHQYNDYGVYAVTHSIQSDGSAYSITKPVSVNELKAPIILDIIASPRFGMPNKSPIPTIDVDFFSDCEGIIAEYTWKFTNVNTGIIIFSFEKDPVGIQMVEKQQYIAELNVKNKAGEAIKSMDVYIDPDLYPYASILDWEVTYYVHDLEVSTANFNDSEPIEFTISFGDGITETYTEDYSSYHAFTHVYYELGEYIVFVTVKQGSHTEIHTAKRVCVQPRELDVTISYTSPSAPPHPTEQIVCNATVTGAAAGSILNGNWGIYRVGSPNSYYSENFPIQATHIPEFKYTPDKAGRYIVMLYVNVSGFAASGYAAEEIEVVNAPKYMEANISSGSYLLSLNSEYTFYSSVWPTGDPGIPVQDWNPTNIRWTLKGPQTNIVENITFPFDVYYFSRYFTHKFEHEGIYTLQLETWNKNHQYVENGEIDTSNNCRLSYYNYDINQIEVKKNIPSLTVVAPIQTYYQPDAGAHTLEIKISNPSTTPINWVAEYNPGCGFVDWFQILNTYGSGLCCGSQQIITVNILANSNEDNRFGCIRIRGYANGIEIQGSPAGVVIDQYGTEGPWRFIAEGSSPDINFGFAVAVDGKTAAIGSPHTAWNIGQAYIYRKSSIGTWVKISTLKSSDNNPDFGRYIDLAGDNACVLGSDKVYFFKRGNPDWTGVVTELKYNNTSQTPKSVAIWGDYAVVGLPSYSNYRGKVAIFYRNQGGVDNWGIVKELIGDGESDFFGNSVDLYNDQLVVGAPQGGNRQGYLKIFDRNLVSGNDWGEAEKIIAPDFGTYESGTSEFGKEVSIFENTISTLYYRWMEPAQYLGNGPRMNAISYRKSNNGNWDELGRGSWTSNPNYNHSVSAASYKQYNDLQGEGIIEGIIAWFGMPEANYLASNCTNGSFGRVFYGSGKYSIDYHHYFYGAQYEDLFYGYPIDPHVNDMYGNSVGLSYYLRVTGIPGLDVESVNRGGALFDNNYKMGNNLCEAGINLELVNFSKPAGTYSDVVAKNISLGGRSLPANIENGANIEYKANELLLKDGFLADHGSNFTALALDCGSGNSDMLVKKSNQNINFNEWPLSDESRKFLIKAYMRAFPDLPWQTFNLAEDADFVKAGDVEAIQKAGNKSFNNSVAPSRFQTQEMPDFPVLLLNDSEIKLKIGSSITLK
ncbi:MAG: peptidoglycan DD-metalloendopeptidase family protein [Bacteroidota bacterium]